MWLRHVNDWQGIRTSDLNFVARLDATGVRAYTVSGVDGKCGLS